MGLTVRAGPAEGDRGTNAVAQAYEAAVAERDLGDLAEHAGGHQRVFADQGGREGQGVVRIRPQCDGKIPCRVRLEHHLVRRYVGGQEHLSVSSVHVDRGVSVALVKVERVLVRSDMSSRLASVSGDDVLV